MDMRFVTLNVRIAETILVARKLVRFHDSKGGQALPVFILRGDGARKCT
jgi:hypothetical protein